MELWQHKHDIEILWNNSKLLLQKAYIFYQDKKNLAWIV